MKDKSNEGDAKICAATDCDYAAVTLANISIDGAPKKSVPVCRIHAEAAKEDVSDPEMDARLAQAQKLKTARALLGDALCHSPQHAIECHATNFARHNQHLPSTHPAWAAAPLCNCWVGRMAAFLNEN